MVQNFLIAIASMAVFFTSCKKQEFNTTSLKTEIFHSTIVDDEYKLFYILPKDYSSSISYPVIFFLDGNWYYEFFQEEVNSLIESGAIPPCIVIGIGYPFDGGYKDLCPHCTDKEDDVLIPRFRDFTYPTVETWTIPTGEGDAFAEFLNEELIPKVEIEYSIDTSKLYLMGHSLGGLNMFYNMFEYPNSKFEGYAALSASLYWGEGATFQLEENYSLNHTDLNTKLYVAYGTSESGSLAVHNAELIDRIEGRSFPSLTFKTEVFKGASHRQVSWEGFRNGMIFFFNE